MSDFTSFPNLLQTLTQGRDEGHHTGAQLYIRKGNEIALDAAWGLSKEGVPMTHQTLMTWLSASKPITSIVIGKLLEQGKLSLEQRIVEFLPDFGQGGKESLTILHLLTHTGGFRSADSTWNRMSWDENIAHVCETPLEPGWTPGHTAGYHRSSSWFILGEIIVQITRRPFADWVRQEIFLPLGMTDCWFAITPDRYQAYGNQIGHLHNTAVGRIESQRLWDTEEGYAQCWPGSTGHGPIRELARIYEMFAGQGTHPELGVKILEPSTVALLTRRWRTGAFDLTFQQIIDWGLGLILNSNRYGNRIVPYGFGPHSSEETFGHSGAQSSCSFHDPEKNLVVAWVVNGMAGEIVHRHRAHALNSALYQDLGLAQ